MAIKIYRWLRRTAICGTLSLKIAFLGAGVIISLCSKEVSASERVIFTYGGFTQSVSLEELEEFTNTGEVSSSLNTLLNRANQNPFVMRWILRQEFPANTKLISDLLNTIPGEYVLSQTGNVVGAKSKRANVEALRGTLVTSASDNNLVSLIELLDNYPTHEVYVNGKVLAKLGGNFGRIVNDASQYIKSPLDLPQN